MVHARCCGWQSSAWCLHSMPRLLQELFKMSAACAAISAVANPLQLMLQQAMHELQAGSLPRWPACMAGSRCLYPCSTAPYLQACFGSPHHISGRSSSAITIHFRISC